MPMTAIALVQAWSALTGQEVMSGLGGSGAGAWAVPYQLKEIYNQAGRFLRDARSWRGLVRRVTWTSLATEDQGSLATVLGEADSEGIIFDTVWNNTTQEPVVGPLTDQDYQVEQAVTGVGVNYAFYIKGGNLYLLNVPVDHTISFLFRSQNWLQTTASSGIYVAAHTADTNVPIFADTLMMDAYDLCWKRVKKQDSAAQEQELRAKLLSWPDGAPAKVSMDSARQLPRPQIIVPRTGYL